jgi:cysteine synthase
MVESSSQLPRKPDVVVTCVGGGGLLNGVLLGLSKVGWEDVPVVAMETEGADCFNQSVKAGKIVTLPDITRSFLFFFFFFWYTRSSLHRMDAQFCFMKMVKTVRSAITC